MKVNLQCSCCEKRFMKEKKEINRILKTGRTRFFCSVKCGSQDRPRIEDITQICLFCGKFFVTKKSGKHSSTFCSRSCASGGSVTDKRRSAAKLTGVQNQQNLSTHEQTLKKREMWKYQELHTHLKSKNIDHEFEYKIGDCVVDLIFFKDKKIIEFDGPYHKSPNQKYKDEQRDLYLKECGFNVNRIVVKPSSKIPVSAISGIFV